MATVLSASLQARSPRAAFRQQQRHGALRAAAAPRRRLGGFMGQGGSRLQPAAPLGGRVEAQKQKFGSFEELIQGSDLLVLVEVYATWCGPCAMMGRTLEEVAPTLRGKVKFVKINSEKYERLAGQLRVSALPTLILFRGGREVDRVEGMLPEPQFRQWLGRWL